MVDVVGDARWLRAVLDSTAQAVLVLDQQGRIVLANRRCQELFGYSAEDLVERDAWVVVPGVNPAVALSAEERHEVTAVRSDATELPVEVLLSPVTAGEAPSSSPRSATAASVSGSRSASAASWTPHPTQRSSWTRPRPSCWPTTRWSTSSATAVPS